MPYEHKVKIGNIEYLGSERLKSDSFKLNRRLFSDFSIGNVSSAEIELEIWPVEEPPVTAEIIPYVKGPDTLGRWVQLGVFYTDERTRNSGTLTLHGYDAMYKADVDFKTYGAVASWPLSMSTVLSLVANTMGIRVDKRTVINPSYTMDYPEDYTCMDILKHIAAAHAGNFIITQMNELLLIPLIWSGNTISTQTNALSFEKYAKFNPVRKVVLSVDDKMSYTAAAEVAAGTQFYTMNAFCPSGTSQMAQNILTDLSGFEYQGFSVGMAAIPPTTQLWDTIAIRNYTGPETYEDYTGKIAEISINFGPGFYSDVSAPGDSEAVHEYIGKASAKDIDHKLEETASNLRTEFEENSLKIYRYNSNSAFTITDGQAAIKIIDIDYKAKPGGDVVFHAEIKHTLAADAVEPGVDDETIQEIKAEIAEMQAKIAELKEQIAAILETVGIASGSLTASVENDILVITGTGASTKDNYLVLISGDVVASDNILHFGGDTVQAEVENNALTLDGASVSDNQAVIVSPGATVRDNVLYV